MGADKAFPRLLHPESPTSIPMNGHPEPSTRCSTPAHALDARRRICPAALQGSRASKQPWIALRCSRADPSASHPNMRKPRLLGAPASRKPCRTTLQFAQLASGWRLAGVRWIASHAVCVGYGNSGNRLKSCCAFFDPALIVLIGVHPRSRFVSTERD